MPIPQRRQTALIGITLVVTVAGIALTLPGGTSVRQALTPQLPMIVLTLGTVTGVWQLVTGIIAAVAHRRVDTEAAAALLLGASAICLSWAFLPPAPHVAPQLLPLIGSALFAAAAAALPHVARAWQER